MQSGGALPICDGRYAKQEPKMHFSGIYDPLPRRLSARHAVLLFLHYPRSSSSKNKKPKIPPTIKDSEPEQSLFELRDLAKWTKEQTACRVKGRNGLFVNFATFELERSILLAHRARHLPPVAAITASVVSFPRHYHRELGALTGGVATVDPLKILKQHSAQSLIYLNIFYFSCTSSKSRQRGRIQKPVDLGI